MSDPDHRAFRLWSPIGAPALIGDPLVQCLILIVITSAFFLIFPGIDIWFSGLFYEPGQGFSVSRLGAFIALRQFHRGLTWIIPVALVLVLLAKIAFPWRRSLVPIRAAIFILSTLAIGPGIVVNLIFKNHWGRPRPTRVLPFGADQPFIGVWQITDYCATNCSFVSGEASSAIWLLTLIVLLPPDWRARGTKIIIGLAIALSLNRVAFGGHFLSDVLLAWWITLAIMALVYRYLYERPPAVLTEPQFDAAFGHAGLAIRRLFARPPTVPPPDAAP